ncbi:Vacuolar protein sorting-associated protein 41 [Rhodotorula mucilaginosa]|uniref:Vacuolar protein sorting-associated protein 41 n=1 Tax=Rhodotorula mucilaginosa TaxID=5537 RepID=A0A9P7B2E3_RHOMI|nr:Vacuolar protein sorting-associated protein 41 [Rhodotorula mucilaginosa]TKA51572.1 hypothetical protein B0A53_05253 [Rhodotorula sp. CCFEE 5036]
MPASSRGSPSAPYSLPLSPSRASTATTVSAVLSTGGGGGSPPSTSRSPSRSGRPPSRAMSALSNAESSSSSWTGKARDDLLEQPVVVPQTDDTLLHAVTSGGSVKVDRQHLPSPPILDADDAETTDSSFEQEEDAEEEEDSSSDEEVAGAPPPLSRAALQADDRPPDQHPTNGRLGNGGEDSPAAGEQSEAARDSSADEQEGEDDDEEEEDGDEEEDEEDEEEPTLKYSRLEGSTAQIFSKDTASAIAVCEKYIIVGSHNGMIFVLSPEGRLLKRFRPHSATINDLSIDSTGEYVGSASMDGLISIQSLVSTENHTFDMRRPMRCIALDPNYIKRNTRQFVSGGMAGSLVLSEKGWLGQKDVTLYSGEGPIWAAEWRGTLIAWASDAGVRIYDTATSHRITYISRSDDSPRADLFKCTLRWQDDRTLLIAWADVIKVASIREREAKRSVPGLPSTTELYVEVTAILQVDCMISGIASYGPKRDLLVLAYTTEEDYDDETAGDRDAQRRKSANRPELRIISRDGEELSSDAISLRNYARFQCRDYSLEPTPARDGFLVVSPEDIVVAETRDEADHIAWLIETQRYDEALKEIERTEEGAGRGFDVTDVGKKYLDHLVSLGRYDKAASECPRILGINAKLWEHWVFLFAEKGKLDTIIPYVPTHDPTLSRLVYEMILAHFLRHDPEALLKTTRSWPIDIYDIGAVTVAIKNQIEREPKSETLMRAISELYLRNRQPGKALPYFLKLRDPHAFVLVRDYNLFTDIQDQALQLIEFDEELRRDGREKEVLEATSPHGIAIDLLVDHTHSIPDHRKYLYMYLDALFDKDAHLAFDYSDLQVDLYAEFKPDKLMDFLRASNYYSLERAYQICDARDLVPEMVFLLGRMGDNKRALTLIIERLGDVQRAIDFAREQNDTDLWEDLLKYCETKPRFIRGLLENVGVDVDPIRLIRRIQNGLEIPGLKPALIKILQDFQLQISLMDGCKSILYGDCRNLALSLHSGQTGGFLWTGDTTDYSTGEPIFPHLSGGVIPAILPVGVHFLSGRTFTGTSAFPSLAAASGDLSTATLAPVAPLTKRDQLVAASLLASFAEEDDDEHAAFTARKAVEDAIRNKIASVKELQDERRSRPRRAVRVDV